MKLVLLMYLEEDEGCVDRLLRDLDVPVFSRLSMEGVGEGAPGWYGEVPPYESRMTFAIVDDGPARRLMDAVAAGSGGLEDLTHPVRAVQLAVERTTACGEGPTSIAPEAVPDGTRETTPDDEGGDR